MGKKRKEKKAIEPEIERDVSAVVKPAEDGEEREVSKLIPKAYEKELSRLQVELARMQTWVRKTGSRIVVIFEGRDAAGKGGTIGRIMQPMNPRFSRVVALDKPTERERTQWYFQRYVPHLPAAGEIVLFDRSWYNRAGVEWVMGYCTEEEYREFLRSCPMFERLLIYSGIQVIKYWFSVSPVEQERRFQARIKDPTKRWKLSDVDLQSRARWDDYSRAKDQMMLYTDIPQARWYTVNSNDKRRARLNCITHLLGLIPYERIDYPSIDLPPRTQDTGYLRPSIESQNLVPEVW